MELTHLSLFSGIGGIDLAAELAGFETIGQVEFADYPYKVLCKRWPDVPKWRDVRDVTSGSIREKYKGHITLVSGGFPCQPFSIAGKRRGKEDPRFLWKEMLRLVQECRPSWIFGENVAGIITMELDNCIADLENQGYTTRSFLIPACSIGACHRRDRIFIVAHNNNTRDRHNRDCIRKQPKILQGENTNNNCKGLQGINQVPYREWEPKESLGLRDGMSWYEAATKFCRVDDGVPHRVDRLKCLGNAVVPQQAYPILKCIADIENSNI